MSNIRDKIYEALTGINENVFFGKAQKLDTWDYIVYMRENTTFSPDARSKSRGFAVAVVNEDFIDEDMEETIISAMESIPGIKRTGDIEYDYTEKPDTDKVAEVMVVHFVKAEKRCFSNE